MKRYGYTVIETNAKENKGIELVQNKIKNNINALSGN